MLVDDLDFTQTRGTTEVLNSVLSFAGERVECEPPFSEKRLVVELRMAAKAQASAAFVYKVRFKRTLKSAMGIQ